MSSPYIPASIANAVHSQKQGCGISTFMNDMGNSQLAYVQHAYTKTAKLHACDASIRHIETSELLTNTIVTREIIVYPGEGDPPPLQEGKIAHFFGDIYIDGVIDPTGLQLAALPAGHMPLNMSGVEYVNAPDQGMVLVSDQPFGAFSNTLVYTDGTNQQHTMGDMFSSGGGSSDNALARYDGATGKLLQDSGIALSDTNEFSTVNPGDNITINAGTGDVIVSAANIVLNGAVVHDGLLLNEQASNPFTLVQTPTQGAIYAKNGASYGNYLGNYPVYADGFSVDHVLGDVIGPVSSTDNALARYDGATGKFIQNSGIALSDTNVFTTTIGGDITFNIPGGDLIVNADDIILNGDVILSGSVTQSGLLLNQQTSNPFTGTQTATQAVIYARTGATGNYAINRPVFVDGSFAEHVVGDVMGPASSTDNALARYDGATGKFIQNSGIALSDTNVFSTTIGGNITFNVGAGDLIVNADEIILNGDVVMAGAVTQAGLLLNQQATNPFTGTQTATQAVIYAKTGAAGNYAINRPVFVDGSFVEHVVGDVMGPATSTANAIARYNGATGKFIQDSNVTLAGSVLTALSSDLTLTAAAGNVTLNSQSIMTLNAPGQLLLNSDNVTVSNNMYVMGSTFTTSAETLNVADNFIYVNDGYVVPNVGMAGGLVVNYLPSSSSSAVAATGFVAATGLVSARVFIVDASGTLFVPGDFVQVSGSNNQANDGIFEVASQVGNVLSIRGAGPVPAVAEFVQTNFTTDAVVAGQVTKVSVALIGVSSTGEFLYQYGDNITNLTIINVGSAVLSLVSSDPRILVDNTDPQNPILSLTSALVSTVNAADASITVDNTDPQNPLISLPPGTITSVVAGTGITVTNPTPEQAVVSLTDLPVLTIESPDSSINVDNTDPQNPKITIAGGGSVVQVNSGTGITVDNTNPAQPVVNLDVPVLEVNGGTGNTTYVAGDILYATGPSTLVRLPRGPAYSKLGISDTTLLPEWKRTQYFALYTEEEFGNVFTTDTFTPLIGIGVNTLIQRDSTTFANDSITVNAETGKSVRYGNTGSPSTPPRVLRITARYVVFDSSQGFGIQIMRRSGLTDTFSAPTYNDMDNDEGNAALHVVWYTEVIAGDQLIMLATKNSGGTNTIATGAYLEAHTID